MPFEEHYAFRGDLVSNLVKDLIGPEDPQELLIDPPLTHYLSGILYPQGELTVGDQDESDRADLGEDGEALDPPVALATTRYPSSMGVTFAVDSSFKGEIIIESAAGRYEEVVPTSETSKDTPTEPAAGWRRHSVVTEEVRIGTTQSVSARKEIADGLAVFYRVRSPDVDGAVPVTVVLLNTKRARRNQLRDAYSFRLG